jgi:selenocysteine lyase/cysteine desulfurase
VVARIAALNTCCKDGLAAMPHVTLHTPRDRELSAGIICFDVDGMAPDAARLLEKRVVASASPYRVS